MPERATSRLGSSVLDLSVDDRAFNKGIKGVVDHTKHAHRAFDTMGIKAEKLSGRIGNLNKGLKMLGGASVLGGVIVGMAAFTRAITNNIIEMKVLAATAGLSTKAMQEYSYMARQAGISQAGLIDGVKELNLRIDEFAKTGYGPGAEALARLGYTMDDFNSQLIDSDDRFASVINALMRIEDIGSRLRIADEIFGGTGGEQYERLIRLLSETGKSVTDLRQRAHDLGIVLDDELVDNVRNVHLKFLELKDVISTQLTKAILDLLPPADELDEILQEKIPLAVQKAIKQFEKLRENIKKLGAQFEELLKTLNYVVAGWAAMKAFTMAKALGPIAAGGIATVAGLGAGEQMSNITGQPGPLDDMLEAGHTFANWVRDELVAYGVLKKRFDDVSDSMGELKTSTDELNLATGEKKEEPYTPDPIEPFNVKNFFDDLAFTIKDRLSFDPPRMLYGAQTGEPFDALATGKGIQAYIDRDALQALDPGFAYLPEFGNVLKEATSDLKSMGFDVSGTNDQITQSFAQRGIMDPRQMKAIISGAFERAMVKLMIQQRSQAGAGAPGLDNVIGPQGFAGPGTAQWDASTAMYLADSMNELASKFGMDPYFDPTADPEDEMQPSDKPTETAKDALNFAALAVQTEGLVRTFSTMEGTVSFLDKILAGGLTPHAILLQVVMLALKEVFTGMWEILGPAIGNIIRPLVEILRAIGRIVGTILTPAFTLLAIPVNILAGIFKWLYKHVIIPIGNGIIDAINGVIWALNLIPFVDIDYVPRLKPPEDPKPEPPPKEGDGSGVPYELTPDPWDPEDEAEGGERATFRQQRPINVTINFPGNVYAVGEGGFREFAELMAEEFKRLGYLGRS